MTTNDALTCQQVVELVTAYLENTLLPAMRKQLEEHVAECPGCANYIEQVRLTMSMLRQRAQEPVFPATEQKLLKQFRNWRKGVPAHEEEEKYTE